jgi:hypothetical protein
MYSTTLELLGLGLFFVVNILFSVMIGNDLFAFFGNSGMGPSNRWVKILAGLLLIALSMNFTSSVLTMMTLGNLQAKFGDKGEKILLSPEYRKELSSIEGMFVATIVLITVLSFRLYFSPTQMAEEMFQWVSETIPEDYIKWGHMFISFIVLVLGLALMSMMDRYNVYKHPKPTDVMNPREQANLKDVSELPEDFRVNFKNLFWVLMTIFLIYFTPMLIPLVGSFNTTNDSSNTTNDSSKMMTYMSDFFTKNSISTFTLFKLIFVPLTLAISAIAIKYKYDKYVPVIGLSIATMMPYLSTLLFNLFDKRIPEHAVFMNIIDGLDGVFALSILFTLVGLEDTKKNIFDAPKNDISDTPYIYHKILISLLFLFPAVYVIIVFLGMRLSPKENPPELDGKFSYYAYQLVNIHNLFMWNLVDAFWVIRTFLLALAMVFAGLTINSFHKIEDLGLYHKFYHLKEVFGSFIVFLMIVLPFSLFDTRSVSRIMTLLIEYLSPIAVIIMMCLLVVYSNHLSKLSNKELIGDVSSEDDAAIAEKKSMESPNADKISRNVFNGVDTAI